MRQFLGQMDKPDVDLIEGLSPAISIDQKQQAVIHVQLLVLSQKSMTICAYFMLVLGIQFVQITVLKSLPKQSNKWWMRSRISRKNTYSNNGSNRFW